MAIDFFGVRLAGRIRQFVAGSGSGPGKVVELWTENQDSELTKNFGALAFVSEINVNLKMGDNASIALVLTPPFEDALKFMQSELVRFGNGRLEVEIGYTTGTFSGSGAITATMLPFSGFLQKPDISIGSDITITLHALGVGYQMNVVGGLESETFDENTSPAKAVLKTLQKYVSTDGSSSGLTVDEKTLYQYVPTAKQDPQSGDKFFRIPTVTSIQVASGFPDAKIFNGVVHKGPRNDWWFVKETVQENGYDLFIQGNKLYIVEKTFWMTNGVGDLKPRKQFLLRGNVDPTLNMFPILSFQSPTEGVWMQPGVGRLAAFDVDPNKKKTDGESHTASAEDTPIARGKESADPADLLSWASGIISPLKSIAARIMAGDPNDPDVQKRLEAHWMDLNMQDGVQGQFTTIGVPDLVPGDVIEAGGFEPFDGATTKDKALFNGVYGVLEVNHKVGVGGWETNFLGIMNTFPKAFEDAVKQSVVQASADQSPGPGSTDSTAVNLETISKQVNLGSSGSVFGSPTTTKTPKPDGF
jgi:hypothetical protein